jgi:O-antigen/teichoic acid export membrane protein
VGCQRDMKSREPTSGVGNPIFPRALGRVVGRASWAVADQALYSASTFTLNLLLALWVTPAEYGGYMAATATFWVALLVYDALLMQPMMVFGSVRYHDRPTAYLAILMFFHWCASAIISAALAVGGLALMFWGSRTAGSALLGYAAAVPLMLLLWLVRRRFYVWGHVRLAAVAGVIYMFGMFAITFALHRSGMLSPFTAPLAAGAASALAVAALVGMRHFRLRSSGAGEFSREVARAHWRYSRWAVLTAVIAWARGGIYFLVVPALVGLPANAALNVLWNLVAPAILVSYVAPQLLVPTFSRARQDRRAAPLMWVVLPVLVAGASLYALFVGLFGGTLIDFVYRGRYSQYNDLAWLIGLIVPPTAAFMTFQAFLRAHERPDREFSAYVCATLVTCFGIVAIEAWGLFGAIIGLLASAVATMLVMFWWVLRMSYAETPGVPVTAKKLDIDTGSTAAYPSEE